MPEERACWNADTEKLLCLMVLNDDIVQRMLLPGAPPAYWRAFIVQNRSSGLIYCKFRFKQHDSRNWYQITPTIQNDQTVQELRRKMEATFRLAVDIAGGDADKAIECFFPPDDNGDYGKTLIWLEMQDLIEIRIEGQAQPKRPKGETNE